MRVVFEDRREREREKAGFFHRLSPALSPHTHPDALTLRRDARLVGAMLGALPGFKQQNSACGLPLRLLPEEVVVGWEEGEKRGGRGARCVGFPSRDTVQQSHYTHTHTGWLDLYTLPADPDADDPFPCAAAAPRPPPPPAAAAGRATADWQVAAATPTTHYAPTVTAPPEARVAVASPPGVAPGSPAAASIAVVRDLRRRGYHVTPGANFGAHWLAYPADPVLYHAQLCVRVCGEGGGGAECGTLLAAAARGAHAARKHLLLAWPTDGGVHYVTLAPEAGFGSG